MQSLPDATRRAEETAGKAAAMPRRARPGLAALLLSVGLAGFGLPALAQQQDPATGYPLPPVTSDSTAGQSDEEDRAQDEDATPGLSDRATDPGLASEDGLDRPGEAVADWLPPAIELPEDMQVVINSAIGASTRLLQFSTHEDAEDLIARWREALRETGWQVDPSPEMIENQQILFSGPGIGSAQVIIIPSQADGAQVIQIDASLNLE